MITEIKSCLTYARVEEETRRYHEKHQTFTTFPKIVKRLLLRGSLVPISTADEDVTIWSDLSDEQFLDLLNQIPLGNIYLKDIHADNPVLLDIFDTYSIDAESIMPEGFRFYALKYIPFIKEQMHIHDYFELNYVFCGQAKMIFENQTRILPEGSLFVIAPGSRHDVTVEEGNVALSLLIRKTDFESAFFQLLSQEDLVADFFRSILY